MAKKRRIAQVSYDFPPEEAYENPEDFMISRPTYNFDSLEIAEISKKKEVLEGYIGDINNRKNDSFLNALKYFGELNSDEAWEKIKGLKRRLGIFSSLGVSSRHISLEGFYNVLRKVKPKTQIGNYERFVKDLSGFEIHYGKGSLVVNLFEKNGKTKVKVKDDFRPPLPFLFRPYSKF